MSGKLIAHCSLTYIMLNNGKGSAGYEINFPEHLASLVHSCKLAIQKLQIEIIDAMGSDNLVEIGHCFEKLEESIDSLIAYSGEKH